MRRWCTLTADRLVRPGDFLEAEVSANTAAFLHTEPALMDELAKLLMNRYESMPSAETLVLPMARLQQPTRTKAFYSQLFDGNGNYTPEFITCASETLAWWLEMSFEDVLHAEPGLCHNNLPTFDIISILESTDDTAQLRVTQVKATKANLQDNCSQALSKFSLLEEGRYDQQLLAQLHLLERARDVTLPLPARELLFDRNRRYRVTAIHEEDRHTMRILTTYDRSIVGPTIRRSVRLVRVSWQQFWDELGRRVYAQLN